MENQAAAFTRTGALQDQTSTAAAKAVLTGESRLPCKLRMRIAQTKADLIRQREIELLLPAAGPGATEVLRLLRPPTKTGVSTVSSQAATTAATTDVLFSSPSPTAAQATGVVFSNGESVSVIVPALGGSLAGEASTAATASDLVGMSCTIGSSGEVCRKWGSLCCNCKVVTLRVHSVSL
jgi:hypothetical protein